MEQKKFFNLDEIHIKIVLKDVLKNIWLAVLAMVIACIAVYSYGNLRHQPKYTTDATFVISPKSNGSYVGFYASLNTANEMATVLQEVFTSDVLKRMIKEDLKKDKLWFDVTADVAKETNILCVSVVANSPDEAHAVMQSLMRNYEKVSDYMFGMVVLDVLKNPRIPISPSNMINIRFMMIAAGLFAAALMILLIALLSVLRQTIKTVSAAKRYMGESPLGILIDEKRNLRKAMSKYRRKSALLIIDAFTSFRYVESLLQIAHKIRHRMTKNNHKVLLITSVAENEGKSALAANIALAFAKHGYRVALLDTDMRRPAVHKIFKEQKDQYNVYDFLSCIENGLPPINKDDKRVSLFTLEGPCKNIGKILHSDEMRRLLNVLKQEMDFVIMDSAPYSLAADTGILLQLSDSYVMVVRQDWVPAKVLSAVADDLDEGNAEYLGYVISHFSDDVTEKVHSKYRYKYGYYNSNGGEGR